MCGTCVPGFLNVLLLAVAVVVLWLSKHTHTHTHTQQTDAPVNHHAAVDSRLASEHSEDMYERNNNAAIERLREKTQLVKSVRVETADVELLFRSACAVDCAGH